VNFLAIVLLQQNILIRTPPDGLIYTISIAIVVFVLFRIGPRQPIVLFAIDLLNLVAVLMIVLHVDLPEIVLAVVNSVGIELILRLNVGGNGVVVDI
jgi:hypothetical protein